MILPGTLVQYVGNGSQFKRVFTVSASEPNPYGTHTIRSGAVVQCKTSSSRLWLEGERISNKGVCSCVFRIIAPPITEADRLEASAPVSDAPAKPKRVRV